MEKRLLSVKELSEYIGLSPQTIYNKINRGEFPIPYKKVFGLLKWEKQEVNDYLNKCAIQGRETKSYRNKPTNLMFRMIPPQRGDDHSE
jgi:predicted DNA-binding transcriptional regulator AlpA